MTLLVAFYPLPVFTRDDLGYEYYPLPGNYPVFTR